ncbi:MAG: hypothetical protein RLZZ182_2597 [Pseudomonadota bacterium]
MNTLTFTWHAPVLACATALGSLLLSATLPGPLAPHAHAQTTASALTVPLAGVRPEALSWWWDNVDAGLLKAANSEVLSFEWLQRPASPQHLGYSAGARQRQTVLLQGQNRQVDITYLDPVQVRAHVASDNFLGSKPYSFVAQQVSIDGGAAFTVLVQYKATGSAFTDTSASISVLGSAPALAVPYVAHLGKTLSGLKGSVMGALDQRYFNGVLKGRGFYTISKVDRQLNVTLNVTQEIKGITPDMLSWWWDHIGNTERYKLWQPIDHVSFEWSVPPTTPDLRYDIGAVQKVKENIGKTLMTLNITGADPAVKAPPVPLDDPGYFYALANPTLLDGLLPDNQLVHQWKPNPTGDGVILRSTFKNTALARVINSTFFEDLGNHALREFQMLPYFLPRLYRREALGE